MANVSLGAEGKKWIKQMADQESWWYCFIIFVYSICDFFILLAETLDMDIEEIGDEISDERIGHCSNK